MQGTYNGAGTFTANGAIGRNVRVAVSSPNAGAPAQVEEAGANDVAIGVSEYAVADGELVAVRLYGTGTVFIAASEAIAQGAAVYGAANGQIGLTAVSTASVGVALEAAGAAGDIIHVAPYGREIAG